MLQQGLLRRLGPLGSRSSRAVARGLARRGGSQQEGARAGGRLLAVLLNRTTLGGCGLMQCTRGLSSSVPADLGKGVDILAPQDEEGQQRTFLLGYDGRGFEVRDINYRGSILAFPNACFLWRARTVDDITPEALAPILMVKPPIEIVVVGAGEKLDRPLPKATVDWLAKQGVAVEQMDTSSACATFNILNQEDRRVVGALLAVDEEEPPAPTA